MSANNLLFWMSARGVGSWSQYRAAVEELHAAGDEGDRDTDEEPASRRDLPLYQDLRLTLQRLGHAEFFAGAGEADWRVTPPTLAVTRRAESCLGILAGARSISLVSRFRKAAAHLRVEVLQFRRCPDQYLVVADSTDELARVAERADIAFQQDAPNALLTCIPAIDDPAVSLARKLPFGAGWKVERLAPDGYGWRDSTIVEAEASSGGLYRFTLRHEELILYCSNGDAALIPLQVGKYRVLRRRRLKVLRYDSVTERLQVPANFRPPFLIERALILCSGVLPTYRKESGRGILEYVHIPQVTARTIAALLRQDLT